jgi:hypothetical protein
VSTLQLPDTDLSGIYNIILPDYDWDTGKSKNLHPLLGFLPVQTCSIIKKQ